MEQRQEARNDIYLSSIVIPLMHYKWSWYILGPPPYLGSFHVTPKSLGRQLLSVEIGWG